MKVVWFVLYVWIFIVTLSTTIQALAVGVDIFWPLLIVAGVGWLITGGLWD